MDQIDFRLLIGILAVLLAGATKGISGIGLPVVATPILAVLYDLPTAIAVAILPTALSDMPILYTYRSEWRQARRFIPMIVAGMAGVLIGTQILIRVDERLLKAVLGLGVLLFVVISWFHLLPRLSDRFATRWGGVVGLLAGLLQGATGTSAPVITVFFYQLHLPRAAFLFLINIFFEEDVKGSIEAGKYADLVVLGRDILTIDAVQIKDIPILRTMTHGKFVYVNPNQDPEQEVHYIRYPARTPYIN